MPCVMVILILTRLILLILLHSFFKNFTYFWSIFSVTVYTHFIFFLKNVHISSILYLFIGSLHLNLTFCTLGKCSFAELLCGSALHMVLSTVSTPQIRPASYPTGSKLQSCLPFPESWASPMGTSQEPNLPTPALANWWNWTVAGVFTILPPWVAHLLVTGSSQVLSCTAGPLKRPLPMYSRSIRNYLRDRGCQEAVCNSTSRTFLCCLRLYDCINTPHIRH